MPQPPGELSTQHAQLLVHTSTHDCTVFMSPPDQVWPALHNTSSKASGHEQVCTQLQVHRKQHLVPQIPYKQKALDHPKCSDDLFVTDYGLADGALRLT